MVDAKKRVVAIIQARMGSTRLPGKVMADICGRPSLGHIFDRLKRVAQIDEIVVATSTNSENSILEEYCRSQSIPCFRGSENDVLDRFYQAARSYNADVIVRITGDCPLIDPDTMSLVINTFLEADGNLDYVHNAAGAAVFNQAINNFPIGTSTEVVSFGALERAWKEATDPLDRGEGFLCYFWRRKHIFRCKTIPCHMNCNNMRWTLDRPDDLEFIRKIYEKLYRQGECFSMNDILRLLEAEPSLTKINESGIGQEGHERYWKKG